jgi:hypothetical protein
VLAWSRTWPATMARKSRQAGSLEFDPETKQWVDTGARVSHLRLEEVRVRATTDGFHAGFIVGTQVMAVIGIVVGLLVHWT